MNATRILLTFGALSALAPALALPADRVAPMYVTNLSGQLDIQQATPDICSTVNQTTAVVGGRLEITPAEGIDYGPLKYFVLTGGTVSFAPFSVHVSCAEGLAEHTRTYSSVAVQVAKAVDFVGFPSSVPGVFEASLQRQKVVLYQATIANGSLEGGYLHPRDDVAGTIDLAQGTVQMQVVVGTTVHFEWPGGCAGDILIPCVVGPTDKKGTLTATLSGTLVFPDSDGDGVPDRNDNCPFVANRDQGRVPPTIQVPSPVAVTSCAERRFGPAVGLDVCRDLPATVTDDAPDTLRPGSNVVTHTAVDAQGYTATTRQTVNVTDATAPVFSSLPADLRLDNCGPTPLDLPTAEDDCGTPPALGNDAPRSFALGRTEVTWTATDAAGNRATARQAVEVKDGVPPGASCAAADGSGALYRVAATDACTSSPALSLGAYALQNGATIRITESAKPGVRLLGVGKDGIAHYEVGIGEALVSARDASGNVASARCR